MNLGGDAVHLQQKANSSPKALVAQREVLSGAAAVIFLPWELNLLGPFDFHPMAHMVSVTLLLLHSCLLGSFIDWQTRTVPCKQ